MEFTKQNKKYVICSLRKNQNNEFLVYCWISVKSVLFYDIYCWAFVKERKENIYGQWKDYYYEALAYESTAYDI